MREGDSIEIFTPVSIETIGKLKVGDTIYISGKILCGRDAVLPRLVERIENGTADELKDELAGGVMFHTAVSPAGVGPTSSNKLEIESSIEPLSKAGVRIHLGKGRIKRETVEALCSNDSVYAVIPPVTALLMDRTREQKLLAFPELGMEALYTLKVEKYPAVIAAAHGKSIYEDFDA